MTARAVPWDRSTRSRRPTTAIYGWGRMLDSCASTGGGSSCGTASARRQSWDRSRPSPRRLAADSGLARPIPRASVEFRMDTCSATMPASKDSKLSLQSSRMAAGRHGPSLTGTYTTGTAADGTRCSCRGRHAWARCATSSPAAPERCGLARVGECSNRSDERRRSAWSLMNMCGGSMRIVRDASGPPMSLPAFVSSARRAPRHTRSRRRATA
jgi:hypothetical protein